MNETEPFLVRFHRLQQLPRMFSKIFTFFVFAFYLYIAKYAECKINVNNEKIPLGGVQFDLYNENENINLRNLIIRQR